MGATSNGRNPLKLPPMHANTIPLGHRTLPDIAMNKDDIHGSIGVGFVLVRIQPLLTTIQLLES
eukprot:1349313-Amorphochlora_amoeboformis.AAC.1